MALRPLSEKGGVMLDDLMPQLGESTAVQQGVDAPARELQRFEDAAYDIVRRLFPRHADDLYGTLKMWEALLGLPVAAPGVSLETRRNIVCANIRKRKTAAGSDWVDLITTALGGSVWEHQEGPADYTITIRTPYDPASYVPGQVARLARRVTPAHLDLASGLIGGLLIGISGIGDVL